MFDPSNPELKVRRNALLLAPSFTTDDMARVTGLSPDVIKAEMDKLIDEGFFSCTYHITDDAEKRVDLSLIVEGCYE